MKKYLLALLTGIMIIFIFWPTNAQQMSAPEEIKVVTKPTLTHQQEVWRSALEWCESNGVKNAINSEDKDGTPSYYSWQFKPSTFQALGIKYGVLPKTTTAKEISELIKDYQLQRDIVGYMILDKSTRWGQQFPHCTKHKIGNPPR